MNQTASIPEGAFCSRHLGPDSHETHSMLTSLGYDSLEDFIADMIPQDIVATSPIDLPQPLSEDAAQAQLRRYAAENTVTKSFYGQGFSATLTPAVIRRGIIEDAGWYTAYTPYQAEISQGRLEALLVFQTMIESLTGLPVANASLLDESSAVTEAINLMRRANRKGSRVLLDSRLHPQILSVATKRAAASDIPAEVVDVTDSPSFDDAFGVVLAYTGTLGDIIDPEPLISSAHQASALTTVVADPLSLLLLQSPGDLGADISVGSSQRFGVPLFYGGPHAAFMAVTDKLVRKMPGRLVGVSHDADGYPAYRLALQTREQHIRREKATSNICTAQALLAVTAAMYAVYHGPAGLRRIAEHVHRLAILFSEGVQAHGLQVISESFFDTVTVSVPQRAHDIAHTLEKLGYLIRVVDADTVSISCGEPATEEDIHTLIQVCCGTDLSKDVEPHGSETGESSSSRNTTVIPQGLQRSDMPLQESIFTSIHSETQMLRYIRKLADRDLALDRTMIPLGSCTMKLNPTAALEPITWPEFANIHPFAPSSHAEGWHHLIADLSQWLVSITGYDAISLQPNAGAQGEYAGLMAIRQYHESRGDHQRDICLIPASAHGTNAASSAMAHLRVISVDTAEDGSIDMADLDRKLEEHGQHIAAIMITYPSTHGVFEDTVRSVCDKVHAAGGQVYIDGANLNAMTGIAQPGAFGGDVSHLNLHKTFAIPHGGGGPGVGPVAVRSHLASFLPADPTDPEASGIPVVATLYGSAGVLPISWMYIAMMGASGLAQATTHAILNANYLAHELQESFPVLYTGENGFVGHECILDLRALTDASGVSAADVAKRLIDYGFHAPTLAFPVAGTLMVEPTESEDKAELDRFIEAMRSIRAEIQEIIDGKIAHEDSVLAHSPFTAESVTTDTWNYEFSRAQAAYPVASLRHNKYFSPVRRIDEAWGDRHFSAAYPPAEAFQAPASENDQL